MHITHNQFTSDFSYHPCPFWKCWLPRNLSTVSVPPYTTLHALEETWFCNTMTLFTCFCGNILFCSQQKGGQRNNRIYQSLVTTSCFRQCAVHQQQVVVLTSQQNLSETFWGFASCQYTYFPNNRCCAAIAALSVFLFLIFLKILGYRKNAKYHFVANAYHMMAMLALHYYIPEAYPNQTTAALQ